MNAWPIDILHTAIAPLLPDFAVEVLPQVDSTSDELMRRARAGDLQPLLLVAETQTAGRGRMNRPWYTDAWEGTGMVPALTFSLGLSLTPQCTWSGLSLAVGVSVAESLQPLLPTQESGQPRIMLKWPNDLWLQDDRKLGGILLETANVPAPSSAPVKTRYVVIGMGLNILPAPVQHAIHTPPACLREVDPRLNAASALACIGLPLVQTLLGFAEHGFAPFQARFAQRDVLAGRAVTLSNGQQGTAYGVAEDGALLVLTAQGMQTITSAEISVRPVQEGH